MGTSGQLSGSPTYQELQRQSKLVLLRFEASQTEQKRKRAVAQ
jgi:hypothetical protein